MLNISQTLIDQFNQIQPRIWDAVTSLVAEASSKEIRFFDPLTVATLNSDILEELAGQKLVIQFSFDSLPEQNSILVLDQEMLVSITQIFKTEPINTATEELITEIRPILDAIIKGICNVASEVKKESITTSNATFHLTTFGLPENFQHEDELIKATAVIKFEELNGSIHWLVNQQLAAFILDQPYSPSENSLDSATNLTQKQSSSYSDDARSIDLLYDIPLEISVELGRVKMFIKDIVELSNGSIIEMDKVAGDPVDIMVNGKPVARGEVIVIDDNFGVRILEILNPKERIQKI